MHYSQLTKLPLDRGPAANSLRDCLTSNDFVSIIFPYVLGAMHT